MPSKVITNTFSANTKIKSVDVNKNFNDNRTHTGGKMYKVADQINLTNGAWTKVLIDIQVYDNGGGVDTGNNRYTIQVDGYYNIIGQVSWASANLTANKRFGCAVYNNGLGVLYGTFHSSSTEFMTTNCSDIQFFSAGDDIELYAKSDAGNNNADVDGGNAGFTFLTVTFFGT